MQLLYNIICYTSQFECNSKNKFLSADTSTSATDIIINKTAAIHLLCIVSWAKIIINNDTAAGLKLSISGKILNLPIQWEIFSDVTKSGYLTLSSTLASRSKSETI